MKFPGMPPLLRIVQDAAAVTKEWKDWYTVLVRWLRQVIPPGGTTGQALVKSNGNDYETEWVTITGGGGTVTLVSGTLPISVSNGSTAPVISISQAGSGSSGYLSQTDWNTFNSKGSGTITSVALTMPSGFAVGGSPVTTSGTLAVTADTVAAHYVAIGPTSGSPAAWTFRALVASDLPTMVASGASHAPGIVPDPPASSGTAKYLREDATWAVPPDTTGIGGTTGSTDNRLLRADGAGGATVQASAVTVDDDGEIYGYAVKLNQQTGTTYTLAASDTGKIVECSNASAITVTLPNSLPVGFGCTLMQTGAGQVTFSAASGAAFTAYNGKTKCAGQYAAVTIWVHSNSGGSAAAYRIAGTMA